MSNDCKLSSAVLTVICCSFVCDQQDELTMLSKD